jgi:microcystin-dependent protein
MPAGAVSPFAGATAPTGWLLCGGQPVSRATYSDLFAAIGTSYGVGDGSTTFNLPDLRGRVIAGRDMDMTGVGGNGVQNRLTSTTITSGATGLGNNGGSQTHTLSSDESGIRSHTHSNSLTGTTTFAADGHTHGRGDYHAAVGATNGDAGRIAYQASGVYTNPSTYSVTGGNLVVNPNFNHNTPVYGTSGGPSGSASVGLSNGGTTASTATNSHNNVQPTIILNYIIKA